MTPANNPINTWQARELARILAKHSHLDLQSCLAIVVLMEMGELGHTGNELAEAFDQAMNVHGAAVKNECLVRLHL